MKNTIIHEGNSHFFGIDFSISVEDVQLNFSQGNLDHQPTVCSDFIVSAVQGFEHLGVCRNNQRARTIQMVRKCTMYM